jgi:translation initiation factor IF-1
MMRININPGDKVGFINEPVQGVVTSIKGNGLVGVTIEDDFEIDVRAE